MPGDPHPLSPLLNGTSSNADIVSDGGSDTLTGGSFSNRWGINYYNGKYVLTSAKSTSSALRCTSAYPGADIITETFSSSNSSFKWAMTMINSTVSGSYLYDTYKESVISNIATKYVIYNRATSLSSLNLVPVVYSNSYIDQSFSWEVEDPTVAAINSTSGAITGLKSGSTVVTGIPNKGSTQAVSFNLIVVGSEQYGAGVRIATIDGVQYYDFTTPVNNLFDDAVILCEDHRCMTYSQYCSYMYDISPILQPTLEEWRSAQLGSFLWFYRQVNHGAVWDIKLESQWNEALPNVPYIGMDVYFVFRGEKTTAEDLGNIMYGYTGRATGFGATTLYWGGGVAKQGSVNSDEVTQPPYYGDDENDHDMIERGYNLFVADYPDYPDVGYDGIPLDGWLADIADIILGVGS